MPVVPILKSLVLCRTIGKPYHEPTLYNVLTAIRSDHYPVRLPAHWAFGVLTGGIRLCIARILLQEDGKESEGQVLGELEADFNGPLSIASINGILPTPLRFNRPGRHWVRVEVEGDIVGEIPLHAYETSRNRDHQPH